MKATRKQSVRRSRRRECGANNLREALRQFRPRIEQLEDRRLLSIGPSPELPGLHLVDPRPDQFEGQMIYLDFDGAEGVNNKGEHAMGLRLFKV